MRLRLGRRGVLRFVLSVPVAFALVSALATTGAVTACAPQFSLNCNGPTGGGGGDTPTPVSTATNTPTPTPVPGSGGSGADYTAIENLPSLAAVGGKTYYAHFTVCEQPDVCVPYTYGYWDSPGANFDIVDPCCMGAVVRELSWNAVVVNGYDLDPHKPEIFVNGDLMALTAQIGSYGQGYPGLGSCSITAQWYPVQFLGCSLVSPNPTHIDGAHEIDHVTVDGDVDMIAGSGTTQDIDHKFY